MLNDDMLNDAQHWHNSINLKFSLFYFRKYSIFNENIAQSANKYTVTHSLTKAIIMRNTMALLGPNVATSLLQLIHPRNLRACRLAIFVDEIARGCIRGLVLIFNVLRFLTFICYDILHK